MAEDLPGEAGGGVRLLDLLAGLSLVADLGMAQPPEESLRSALVATGLARHLDLPDREVADCLYTALLQHVGCTAFAHETAMLLGGDDLAVNAAGSRTDFSHPSDMLWTFLPELTRGAGPLRSARLVTAAMRHGSRIDQGVSRANCEVAAATAARLGLGTPVQAGLLQMFEWWNGKGSPHGLAGDDLTLPVRVTHVASVATLLHSIGGTDLALTAVRRRAGRILDPAVVAAFEQVGPELLAHAEAIDPAAALLEVEPSPVQVVRTPQGIEAVARAFGDVVALKSPWFHTHPAVVAAVARAAAARLGLAGAALEEVHLAAWLQDIGRVGVPAGVWAKPGALTTAEREQVRLHAYHSERILHRSPTLAAVAVLAGLHHERCDASGYHRGVRGAALPMAARVLAAADTYAALTQDRPHRPCVTTEAAAATLSTEVAKGLLDGDAARAVLEVAGHVAPRLVVPHPRGLTDRQVEVLRLLARGLSNREIARRLVISPRTAEHHVADIYLRIGVSSRAAATLFAMQHDLIL